MAPKKPDVPPFDLVAIRAEVARRRTDPAAIQHRAEIAECKASLRKIETGLLLLSLRRRTRGRLGAAQLAELVKHRRDADALYDKIYNARAAIRAIGNTKTRQAETGTESDS